MKRLFVCFLILLFAGSILAADEYVIGKVSYYEYEYGNLESFNFKYDDKLDVFYIQTSDWYTTGWIELSHAQLKTLRETLQKALDWAKVAEDNSSEISKEIPNSTIITNVTWKEGDEWYKNEIWDKLNIHIHFIAAIDKGESVSSIFMAAGKVASSENRYIKYEFPTAILFKQNISSFAEVISEENIKNAIDKHNEAKKAEDLFQ